MEIAKMAGIPYHRWQKDLSPNERAMYRDVWKHTPAEDRTMPPEEWQLKYFGRIYVRPPPSPRPRYTPDGIGHVTVTYPDGTQKTEIPESGCVITQRADGTKVITFPHPLEEWEIRINPDGTRWYRRHRVIGGGGISQRDYRNGVIETSTRRAHETQYPDGTVIIETPDGCVEMRKDGKRTVLANAEKTA